MKGSRRAVALKRAIKTFLRISNSYPTAAKPAALPDPRFTPRCTNTSLADLHHSRAPRVLRVAVTDVTPGAVTRCACHHQAGDSWASWPRRIPLWDVCACRQRVAPAKQAQAEPLGVGKPARIQEPRENVGLPPALRGEEPALGCSLCVKAVLSYLNVFLPWELVLRAAPQRTLHRQSPCCYSELCDKEPVNPRVCFQGYHVHII